jgi:hypothetical protein
LTLGLSTPAPKEMRVLREGVALEDVEKSRSAVGQNEVLTVCQLTFPGLSDCLLDCYILDYIGLFL